MCISSEMQNKLAEYYQQTEDVEKLDLQKQSIENSSSRFEKPLEVELSLTGKDVEKRGKKKMMKIFLNGLFSKS